MVAARSGYVKGGVPVRTPPFLSGIFPPRHFQPRHFSVPTLSASAFVPLRPFCPACLLLREGGRCSSGKVRRTSWKGKSLDCQKREGTALVGEDKALVRVGGCLLVRVCGCLHVRVGKVVGSEGREGPTGAGRCDRWGRTPGCRDCPAWRISGERVPAGPEWRPDNTNRIKNTRFGLSFNEKFGMFVHMNRIRLAEVTLIGHATGSLSGPCAGRGTGGENIWCFMSPAW